MSDEDEEEANEMELENESHHKVCALHGGIDDTVLSLSYLTVQ